MADPERTENLRALLVRLRSVGAVDTISVRDRKSVDSFLDAIKDSVSVTHRTVAASCTELLRVCGEQPFRTDLRLLRWVLQRADYKASKITNIRLTALLWQRIVEASSTLDKTEKSGSPISRAFNKLADRIKVYRINHMQVFDEVHYAEYNSKLLRTLPDIKTIPD